MKLTRRTFSKMFGGGTRSPMDRVGMTTTTFRTWFEQTRIKDHPLARTLTLLGVPESYADRLNCHNLEFWSKHFESRSVSYLPALKRKIQDAKSRLIKIQIDDTYDIGGQNDATSVKASNL